MGETPEKKEQFIPVFKTVDLEISVRLTFLYYIVAWITEETRNKSTVFSSLQRVSARNKNAFFFPPDFALTLIYKRSTMITLNLQQVIYKTLLRTSYKVEADNTNRRMFEPLH